MLPGKTKTHERTGIHPIKDQTVGPCRVGNIEYQLLASWVAKSDESDICQGEKPLAKNAAGRDAVETAADAKMPLKENTVKQISTQLVPSVHQPRNREHSDSWSFVRMEWRTTRGIVVRRMVRALQLGTTHAKVVRNRPSSLCAGLKPL